jgi:hypothetical protein
MREYYEQRSTAGLIITEGTWRNKGTIPVTLLFFLSGAKE